MDLKRRKKQSSESNDEVVYKSEQTPKENSKKNATTKTKKPKSDATNGLFGLISKHSLLCLFTIRTLSVLFNLVWDCDETFNYWEPLHFILFGNGFQTWEYSPEYSLRSYLYILLHALPILPFKNFVASKITLFYMLRFTFGYISSKIESDLYEALKETAKKSERYKNIADYCLIFCLTNVGMFLSTTSFLPSTFAMYLVMLAYSSWLIGNNRWAIFSIGLAALLGWPFAGLLGVPICLDLCLVKSVYNKKSGLLINTLTFGVWAGIFGLLISATMIAVDSYMFGKFVFAPLNIFMYNVFPSNPNQGPDLYGREPFSYYIFNCILNFNILFPLAFLCALVVLFDMLKSKEKFSLSLNYFFITLAMLLWCLVFFTRPHKEERFLYPIYPLVLICASVTLNFVYESLKGVFESFKLVLPLLKLIPFMVIVVHAVLSASRGLALFKNYSASIQIYNVLNEPVTKFNSPVLEFKEEINVCVSKEWYRFPSSFFIPEYLNETTKIQKWRLAFLESDFKGQLPGYFNEKLSLPMSTRYVDKLFNDENKEVRQRYMNIKKCDYLIDTDNAEDDEDKSLFYNKLKDKTRWRTLEKITFLDASKDNSRLLRSFYIPYVYESNIKFTYFKLRIQLR